MRAWRPEQPLLEGVRNNALLELLAKRAQIETVGGAKALNNSRKCRLINDGELFH